jgi:hypothetical protein
MEVLQGKSGLKIARVVGNVSSINTGLTAAKARQRLQRFVHLSLCQVKVGADEIEVIRHFLWHETGGHCFAIQAPVHKADRYQVVFVVFADCGCQVVIQGTLSAWTWLKVADR